MFAAIAFAALFVLAFSGISAAAVGGENIAPKSAVTSSPLPNPIWSEKKAADDSLGPTDGWLGEWSPGVVENPWLKFTLPERSLVTGVDIAQAAYIEAGAKRFMRGKNIHIDFIDGALTKRLDFQLKDAEGKYQELKFAAIPAEQIIITIDNVYGEARISNMTGFQEVRIYGDPAPLDTPSVRAKSQPSSIVPPSAIGGDDDIAELLLPGEEDDSAEDDSAAAPAAPKGSLDDDERRILELMRELMIRLEKKFLED